VRKSAIAQAPPKEILALCDKLRDEDLAPLGVALDDQEGILSKCHQGIQQLTVPTWLVVVMQMARLL
jgi:hypothetical protein